MYGTYSNPFVLEKGDIIDIVLNNDDSGKHPFHLHGHAFQAIFRSDDGAGHWQSSNESAFPAVPMRRDTLMARPGSNFVIRFKADNPGKSRAWSRLPKTALLNCSHRRLVFPLPY